MASQSSSRVLFRLRETMLELGEELLDRVEVGRVLGQEQEASSWGVCRFNLYLKRRATI